MTAPTSDAAAIKATEALLAYYNFQDEERSREQLLDSWLRAYPLDWVRLALIEALYQGRYKSASVEYLLQLWQRRGQAVPHFSREFERLVSHKCPQTFLSLLRVPEQEPQQDDLSTLIDELLAPSQTVSPPSAGAREISTDFMSSTADFDEDDVFSELDADPLTPLSHSASSETSLVTSGDLEDLESQLTAEVRHTSTPAPNRVNSATPIHRFKPSSRPSELYIKLAAMANSQV